MHLAISFKSSFASLLKLYSVPDLFQEKLLGRVKFRDSLALWTSRNVYPMELP